MMMRQKQIAQIIQFINTRLTIPSYEIKEEFAAVIIPKAGDDANSVIPPDNVLGQFHKPRDLVPYETGRKQPLTFLESDFTSLLIKWHKEFNAVALANERSATYQSNAQVAIEGFAKRRPPLKRTNSMNSRDGGVKVAAVARARWVAGAANTSKAEKAEKANRKLAKQQQLNTASIVSSNSSTIHETDNEHVESELPEEAPPSAVDEFYLKLLRFHYELPFLAQSSDRAAYLETLVFSVSELFGSNLERFKRSNSFLERYSPARQRWIKAFRKINTRNHTMGVRKRLQKSPSSRHLLLVKEHIYGSEAIKSLSHTNTRQNSDVSIVSQGIDPALIFRVEQLLGAEWLSSEQDFFALLNRLNRDIRTLSTQSKRAAYLEGLTAVVVNRFSHQLQRLKKANTMRQALTLPRQRWVKAIDKVRSMLYTAKLRVRLVRSPSARHLLGVKQQSLMVNDMVARAKISNNNYPKRHTRRDDVMIRDLPQGYKQSGDVNNSAANISAVPARGIEKSSLTDGATTAGIGQSKGLRRIPSGRLQRQVGNNKMTDARRRGNQESSTLQHSNSLRPTMSKQHSSVMLGKLSKSVSTSAASDYTGKHSTLNALDTPSIAELDKVPDGSQRGGRNSLLQRFTDPFVRKTFKKGTVSPTAQQSASNSTVGGFQKPSGGDVTTDRDSLDSRDFPSECVSGESASATPHSMSPSLLYQRLVQSSQQQRSRAGSESDSGVHRSVSNDISGTSTPPLKVLNKSAPSSQHKFSLLNRNHHSNRIVPVTAFEADFGEKLVVVASPGGGSLSRVNTVSNSTSRDSEDYFYVPHDDFRNSNSGSNSRNHSRNNSILKVNTLDSYDSDTNTASNRGLNSTERLYFSEESPSGPSELSPYVAGASSRNSNNNSSKYSGVGSDGGGKSAVYFTKSAPSTPDGTKDTHNNRRVIASSSNAKLGGPHTPPRTLVATQSIRNMNCALDTQAATTGTSTNQSHSSSRHVNTYGGSGAQYKKYDTLGDIARKYNIDAATISRGGEGSGAVPRYAQSTIKSMIRNSNVHDDNVL